MESAGIIEETVSIKVLKVNSRKMTQAVFKQLRTKSIFDAELNLLGHPWGTVNYFEAGTMKPGALHLVWSDGSSLFRWIVCPLYVSFETAIIAYRKDDLSSDGKNNAYHSLPDNNLKTVVHKADSGDIDNSEELFKKYNEHYASFKKMNQLLIAT
ncbi:hypothetical protein [Desulfoluna spongiiphila]|uniref:hypothetical protein n=1 Tax=Desulfoluna spongiiphila TaxID=419481 RepID=UPI000B822E34|nr:hypothetical protein [Desulfoluna spongiiphila]